MSKNKKKEKYVENHGILKLGKDYHVYHMKPADYILGGLIGFGIGAVAFYAFFDSIIAAAAAGIVCALISPRFMRDYRKRKVLHNLREQFRDLLDSLSSSYSAGKNTINAFAGAESDMTAIYGPDADIVTEVKIINSGIQNNLNIETMLLDFAERSSLEDVESFANVFEVCNRQGGDLKRVVCQSRDIIAQKIDIEMEIETMLAGSKNELNIMIAMPVIVILMMRGLGSGSQTALSDILVKTGCIAIFAVAYLIGQKITKIRV